METPSSISNSEWAHLPRGGPWALIAALLMLAALEALLHALPPRSLIPYRNGLGEYQAAADYLSAVGPADVGFVGSSMTRAGVDAPIVREALHPTSPDFYVANYGASGAFADEMATMVRYMARKNALPRLLLVEISPRGFRQTTMPRWNEKAIFWNFSDWREARRHDPAAADRVLPNIVRNRLAESWLTLRYRDKLQLELEEKLLGIEPSPAPMAGDRPIMRNEDPDISIAIPQRRNRLLAAWKRLELPNGQFPLDDHLFASLDEIATLCHDHHTPLIFFEVPYSDAAREALPPSVYPDFYARISSIAARHGIRWISIDQLGIALTDEDYSEVFHLNHRGAGTFSRALAARIQAETSQPLGTAPASRPAP